MTNEKEIYNIFTYYSLLKFLFYIYPLFYLIKVNLGKDYIPERDPSKANAMCNIYPNGAYKCFCKNGHYNGPARNYVWSSSNPKPDDNMLNTFPLYVRTPKCLKFYK